MAEESKGPEIVRTNSIYLFLHYEVPRYIMFQTFKSDIKYTCLKCVNIPWHSYFNRFISIL